MSACPPANYRAKKPDPGQIGAAVSNLGVPDKEAMKLETALRAAAMGSEIRSYELEELPDGSVKFTVVVGPPIQS